MKKVLFLCTGNSCRSIMAEALLNHLGGERFIAFSAGSFPTGTVHPLAIDVLKAKGIQIAGLRSKSWEEFTSKPIDWVITVCDNAALETCPVFPGKQLRAHWGVADPAQFQGTEAERRQIFEHVASVLERRVKTLLRLPIAEMPAPELRAKLAEVGALT